MITAGHSIEYLNGHITDFYTACKKVDGVYAANYLPSTFIVFAVWNIPIKLLGLAPEFLGDWSVSLTMWNKLLPTLIFLASTVILYKLCTERFGFEKKKAMLTVFLTFTSPMAFFCAFTVAAFSCLPTFLARSESLYKRDGGEKLKIVTINDKKFAEQYAEFDDMLIEKIYVVCDEVKRGDKAKILVDIIDVQSNEVVAHGQGKEKDIVDGSHDFMTLLN